MANKQVNELNTITGVLDQNDYILVYDSDEAGTEKLKKRPISDYVATINSNLTLYVATTGNDSTGDGSESNPFASVYGALKYLNSKIINLEYIVTIEVAAGTYIEPTTITDIYPYIHRVIINGDYDDTLSITSIQSSSGSSGNWSVVLNVSDVSKIEVGNYVNVSNCSNITNAEYVGGCWEVTNVDSNNSRITVVNKHRASIFPSGALNADLTVLKTIFDGNNNTIYGFNVFNGNSMYCTGIAYINFDTGLYVSSSSINITNCGFNGCSTAINCRHGGFVDADNVFISVTSPSRPGIVVYNGGSMNFKGICNGCLHNGIQVGYASHVYLNGVISTGNDGHGCTVFAGSTVNLTGGMYTKNKYCGIYVFDNSFARFNSDTKFNDNDTYGIDSRYDSTIRRGSASTTGNGSGDTNTSFGGNIYD